MKRALAAAMLATLLSACATADDAPPAATPATETRALYLSLVDGLHRQGKHRAALAYLDDYDREHPDDPRAGLMRARLLAALDRGAEADRHYRALIAGPYAAQAHNGLGLLAAKDGRWPAAVEAFERAVALAPTDAQFIGNLGYGLLHLGRLHDAEFRLLQALELDPNGAAHRVNVLLCQHLMGKDAAVAAGLAGLPDEARRRIERLLASWPAAPDGGPANGGGI